MKYYWLLLTTSFLFLNCTKEPAERAQKANEEKVTITTGIYGTVSFREGNCMPGMGNRTCKEYPVKRTVRIYEYTLLSQAIPTMGIANGFYNAFTTQLIKEVQSDSDGFFEVALPAGKYTLVVIENSKLYARQLQGTPPDLAINPITVSTGRQNVDFVIDYKAAY